MRVFVPSFLAPTSRSDDGAAPQPKREAKHHCQEHQREAKHQCQERQRDATRHCQERQREAKYHSQEHQREERHERQCQAEPSVRVPGVRSDVRQSGGARLAPKELARRRRRLDSHQDAGADQAVSGQQRGPEGSGG
jgi:DNA segregation ATPase FtsK/SpoIIIE-like protein